MAKGMWILMIYFSSEKGLLNAVLEDKSGSLERRARAYGVVESMPDLVWSRESRKSLIQSHGDAHLKDCNCQISGLEVVAITCWASRED